MMGKPVNVYRLQPDEQLDDAIGKLTGLVRSLDREGTAKGIADSYRDSLEQARSERDRRAAHASMIERRRLADERMDEAKREVTRAARATLAADPDAPDIAEAAYAALSKARAELNALDAGVE